MRPALAATGQWMNFSDTPLPCRAFVGDRPAAISRAISSEMRRISLEMGEVIC